MKRSSIAIAVTLALTACGGGAEDQKAERRREELRPLDPNPPMSASDIDSIVKETRDRDATRSGGAKAPEAENASEAQ